MQTALGLAGGSVGLHRRRRGSCCSRRQQEVYAVFGWRSCSLPEMVMMIDSNVDLSFELRKFALVCVVVALWILIMIK